MERRHPRGREMERTLAERWSDGTLAAERRSGTVVRSPAFPPPPEQDVEQLRSIANVMKASGCGVPDWMLRLQPMRKQKRKAIAVKPRSRKAVTKRAWSGGGGEGGGGGANGVAKRPKKARGKAD